MSERYVMLVSSLPHLGRLFAAKQPPLSHLALERRLRHLEEQDRILLAEIRDLLAWSRTAPEEPDRALLSRAGALLERLQSPTLRAAVEHRLEVRSALAALRRRRRERPPAPGEPWGHGRAARQIEREWSQPQFGLDRRFPWLAEARAMVEGDDAIGLERLLLGVIWHHLERLATAHRFDFEAVVLYVLRWQLIDRRTRADAGSASVRFRSMVDAALRSVPPLPWSHDG